MLLLVLSALVLIVFPISLQAINIKLGIYNEFDETYKNDPDKWVDISNIPASTKVSEFKVYLKKLAGQTGKIPCINVCHQELVKCGDDERLPISFNEDSLEEAGIKDGARLLLFDASKTWKKGITIILPNQTRFRVHGEDLVAYQLKEIVWLGLMHDIENGKECLPQEFAQLNLYEIGSNEPLNDDDDSIVLDNDRNDRQPFYISLGFSIPTNSENKAKLQWLAQKQVYAEECLSNAYGCIEDLRKQNPDQSSKKEYAYWNAFVKLSYAMFNLVKLAQDKQAVETLTIFDRQMLEPLAKTVWQNYQKVVPLIANNKKWYRDNYNAMMEALAEYYKKVGFKIDLNWYSKKVLHEVCKDIDMKPVDNVLVPAPVVQPVSQPFSQNVGRVSEQDDEVDAAPLGQSESNLGRPKLTIDPGVPPSGLVADIPPAKPVARPAVEAPRSLQVQFFEDKRRQPERPGTPLPISLNRIPTIKLDGESPKKLISQREFVTARTALRKHNNDPEVQRNRRVLANNPG